MKETLNTIIVDDEKNNIVVLEHFIRKYCPMLKVIDTCNSYDKALKAIREKSPDLVFLDIVLDHDTSFDLLDEIEFCDFQVIFTTAYDEYAIQAFKYNAIDYILKPVVIEDLLTAVDRAKEHFQESKILEMKRIKELSRTFKTSHPANYITISGLDRVDFVNPENIIYMKSSGRYTEFYVTHKSLKIVSSKTIGRYIDKLDPLRFYRIHNSYIVNLIHLININKRAGNYCEMSNGDQIPISRRRYEGLLKMMKSL